ncbi:MAG TPA: hypothetical protein VH722_08470 [Alphaproteobacteria bacterium]|jgi:hypothetical protein|nr:hypothetical protein [Alphaproteobacteria bacterium]
MGADKRRGQAPDDDFGLEEKIQEYHRHGGHDGTDHARKLEGDIGAAHAEHDHHLKKARPDGTPVRRKQGTPT